MVLYYNRDCGILIDCNNFALVLLCKLVVTDGDIVPVNVMRRGYLFMDYSEVIEFVKKTASENGRPNLYPFRNSYEHTMRVYRWAIRLQTKLGGDLDVIVLAALLHDVDDHKLFITENNMNARTFLQSQNIESDVVEFICEVINGVSFSKNRGKQPESIEGKIVQDADRLDAIGAIGIARAFAFGGKKGRSLESSLQHFNEKLLLLKDEMNTDEAKKIAEVRHIYMQGFLAEIREEMES